MSKLALFSLVASDLKRVDEVIALDTVCCQDVVTAISRHLNASGGKRLRPTLLLLSARACGEHGDGPIRMAAVMETIHAATLVHDDVIDNAEVRRGNPSTNQVWGNQVSVLAGDWLYMQAFSIALRERSFRILDILTDLTKMMVEGELLQAELIAHVGQVLGRFACPKQLRFTDALPKTRSGKIMRRLLRNIAAGREVVGDTTTLEDLTVLAALRGDEE